MKWAILATIMLVSIGSVMATGSGNVTWFKANFTEPIGETVGTFNGIFISNGGNLLYANEVVTGGGGNSTIWKSTDGGYTFSKVAFFPYPFSDMCGSADGQIVWMSGGGTNMARSANGGLSWVNVTPPNTSLPSFAESVACDADGNAYVQAYGLPNSEVTFKTIDDGATWQQLYAGSDSGGQAIAVSPNGKYLTMAFNGYESGKQYVSTDFGASWTPLWGGFQTNWMAVGISDDGQSIFGCPETDQGYACKITTDGGATYADGAPAEQFYVAGDMSGDGEIIAAGVGWDVTTRLWMSTDGGATWRDETGAIPSIAYHSVSLNKQGDKIAVGADVQSMGGAMELWVGDIEHTYTLNSNNGNNPLGIGGSVNTPTNSVLAQGENAVLVSQAAIGAGSEGSVTGAFTLTLNKIWTVMGWWWLLVALIVAGIVVWKSGGRRKKRK